MINLPPCKLVMIKYADDGVKELEDIEFGDWIDLAAAKTLQIKKGEYGIIPLGVAMRLPQGYEAIVLPRSSTFVRYGLIMTNSMGVIDESYCGENDFWGFPFYATRDITIEKNTRIAQFRVFEHQPNLKFIPVKHLSPKSRGGFGSTGK